MIRFATLSFQCNIYAEVFVSEIKGGQRGVLAGPPETGHEQTANHEKGLCLEEAIVKCSSDFTPFGAFYDAPIHPSPLQYRTIATYIHTINIYEFTLNTTPTQQIALRIITFMSHSRYVILCNDTLPRVSVYYV